MCPPFRLLARLPVQPFVTLSSPPQLPTHRSLPPVHLTTYPVTHPPHSSPFIRWRHVLGVRCLFARSPSGRDCACAIVHLLAHAFAHHLEARSVTYTHHQDLLVDPINLQSRNSAFGCPDQLRAPRLYCPPLQLTPSLP